MLVLTALGAGAGPETPSGLRPAAVGVDYRIRPRDILEISVFQEPDLKSTVRVSNQGTVDFPLIGLVAVGGLSTQSASRALEARLAGGYLIHPQVSITVMDFSKRRFIVLGEVQKPGSYDMPDDGSVTVLQAIGIAGGYTRIANPHKVTLLRQVDGRQTVRRIDARRMAEGKGDPELAVEPGDVITVAQSAF